ncbi:MAG: transposase [Anaerolineales bacterium]|uniref:Transposase n=1 Tax=Candidatus Desulfolinea nitratireducens TaxID=2841698 RepID=A0A8J6NJH7_9CHLR|nr:transposase [Candidatus Desulfolinea nitratireducens]MBL6961828.1 transposase [Anaerolineales bacterium]
MANTEPRRRNSLRLKGFDYSQPGAYFITTVTQHRVCLFGEVVDGVMRLNNAGKIVKTVWVELPIHYPHVELGTFVVMPNHVHGVIILTDTVGVGLRPAPTIPAKHYSLSEIMRALKSFSSRRIHQTEKFSQKRIWQRGFHDRIIRNDAEWQKIHLYIETNPANWDDDEENPSAIK